MEKKNKKGIIIGITSLFLVTLILYHRTNFMSISKGNKKEEHTKFYFFGYNSMHSSL